ncbi:MAG: SpoIIIAH-like family protein [[Bacteroides] pectinophilus]|nr:SpoIIIAH-like family protein [[Bacteroides] pectinophilus]
MKKSIGKNQVIITALAVMIAVAGYINYSGNLREMLDAKGTGAKTVSANDISKIQDTDVIEEDSIVEPGTAVLTSSTVTGSIINEAKLNREQIRAKNKESLLEIVNNEKLSESARQTAVKQISAIADYAEKEMAAELLLEAKGFADSVVSISDGSADVVVNRTSLTESEKAQIEDIVKRKSGVSADRITISICNN